MPARKAGKYVTLSLKLPENHEFYMENYKFKVNLGQIIKPYIILLTQ